MEIGKNLNHLAGPIAVTFAYFVLWYILLFLVQSRTKYKLISKYKKEGKVFDRYFSNDPEMLSADRIVGNTQEQMVPFLVSFWLFSIFVSPTQAIYYGIAYIGLRSIYPLLIGRRLLRTQPKRVFIVTGPCYAIIFTLFIRTLYKVFFN